MGSSSVAAVSSGAAAAIRRSPVASSHLASIGFDPDAGVLEVEFRGGGGVWRYGGVSLPEYESILADRSRGSAFHRVVRSRRAGVRVS